MSKQLEQVLDLLINENEEAARELFHDYMVNKARGIYQRQLSEEAEDEDYDSEMEMDDSEMEMDDSEMEMDDSEMEMDDSEMEMDDSEMEGDIEDRVEELEDTLAELQAEFERLVGEEPAGDDFGGDMLDGDMVDQSGDFEDDVTFDMEDGDGDLDDQLSEATKLQDTAPKCEDGNAQADGKPSPFSSVPKKADWSKGVSPVKIKDGSDGKANHGGSVKHHSATNRTKDVPVQKKDAHQPVVRGKKNKD